MTPPERGIGDTITHQRRLIPGAPRFVAGSLTGEFSTGRSGDYSAGTHTKGGFWYCTYEGGLTAGGARASRSLPQISPATCANRRARTRAAMCSKGTVRVVSRVTQARSSFSSAPGAMRRRVTRERSAQNSTPTDRAAGRWRVADRTQQLHRTALHLLIKKETTQFVR